MLIFLLRVPLKLFQYTNIVCISISSEGRDGAKKALKLSWRSISLVIKQWYPWNHGQHLNILILTDSNAISLNTIPQLHIPWKLLLLFIETIVQCLCWVGLGCGCSCCCCRCFCAVFWRTQWKPFQNTFPFRGMGIRCCWFFHLQILN